MAGDGEEEVVVVGWEFGQLIFEHLRNLVGALAFVLNADLRIFRKEHVGQVTQPGLEHGADDVDVVEIRLVKEIDIEF